MGINPSGRDLYNLRNQIENLPNFKGGIIAQRSADSREVQGYTILSKGKKNIFEGLGKDKKFLGLFKTKKKVTYKDLINKYEQKVNQYHLMAHVIPTFAHNKLNNICKEYGWGLRFVPAKGYHFNRETGNFEKNKGAGLEKVIASIIGISILLFALFNVVNI
ncbi:MAG: hypothetical protein NTZ83_02225, partial [Candidatus Pacearchaeota archaeon]|nr:hypothetical protein [Candidatus Pacearchaeota archaeon]